MASYDEEYKAMQYLTQEYVGKICRIWEDIFEEDVCKENLQKLIEHANNFYSELVEESLGRKDVIMQEISDLKKEAEDLKRLLGVDVELPSYEQRDSVPPLLRIQSDMDKSLEGLREQFKLRKEEICELLLQQEALCEELGEPQRALMADPLPTAQELDEFKKYLEDLRRERIERLSKIVALRREIRNFLNILDLKINCASEDHLLNQRQIKVNGETFKGLQEMHFKYALQVQELKERVNAMRGKLNCLWDLLQTSPNTRQKFDRFPKYYNQQTYNAIYSEFERCEQLKRQNIKQYVQRIREEIRECWDKCLKSERERQRFSNYTCNIYTDDLLMLHEMELQDLQLHYGTYKPIYELFATRNELWHRMGALEAKTLEPGRYNNRGGQLLKEEKQRKIIASKLPKLEQQIAELVKAYEQKEHQSFLVYGENIIDFMSGQWEAKRQEKEKVQTARKNVLITSAAKANSLAPRTPSTRLHKNTPSVSSLRQTPQTTRSMSARATTTSKRQLQPSEKITPLKAKRSLLRALDSPSLPSKPSALKNNIKILSSSPNKKSSTLKSSLKKPKPVIGSAIKRRSGRHSNTNKKRKSNAKNIPKIFRYSSTTDYNAEDTYHSFQPSIRSSMIQNCITSSDASSRVHRLNKIADENERLAKLPRYPPMIRTPSRGNICLSPTKNIHNHSSLASRAERKLTTKNLPILI